MIMDAGYSVIPSFLPFGELALFAALVEDALARPRHSGMSRPGNGLAPLRWNDAIVARMLDSERRMGLLRDTLRPCELKWISGYVSTKGPHSPALWWHQDWWCWDHPISFRRSAVQVAVLCYLTDTDAETGALRVLPGSHHAGMAIHAALPEPHGAQADALPADHVAFGDCQGQVTLALRAGDAVVLDYRLLHGTHANTISSRRDCILLSFVPAWGTLPAEIRAHLIAHPALPDASEAACRAASRYDTLLPRYDGSAASLAVNRVPPPGFVAWG